MKNSYMKLKKFLENLVLSIEWGDVFVFILFILVVGTIIDIIFFNSPTKYLFISTVVLLLAIIARLKCELRMENGQKDEVYELSDGREWDHHYDNAVKDRLYLLLLLARSFSAMDKLIVEKKHPNAANLVLVFQLKNGNLRFSIPEKEFPDFIRPKTTKINTTKLNYKNNYLLIEELLKELNRDG